MQKGGGGVRGVACCSRYCVLSSTAVKNEGLIGNDRNLYCK